MKVAPANADTTLGAPEKPACAVHMVENVESLASAPAVKGHLAPVFQRIGVTDRTQAALWAVRHGITSN